jgi:hypothetical protein
MIIEALPPKARKANFSSIEQKRFLPTASVFSKIRQPEPVDGGSSWKT